MQGKMIGGVRQDTWANRGTGQYVNQRFFATNIGSSGTEFFWTGSIWKPVGGKLVFSSAADSSITGTLSETVLGTVSLPGVLVPAGATIYAAALFTYTNSANTKTARIRLGGLGGTAYLANPPTTTAAFQQMIAIRCESTSAQKAHTGLVPAFTNAQSSTANTTSSVDMTADQTLVFTGQLTNTGETITLRGYTVEILWP